MRSFPAVLRLPLAAAAALIAVALAGTPVSAASWRPIVSLASGGHLAGHDSVAISGSTVHVTYTRGGVVYQRSTDGGRTFRAAVKLATSSIAAGSSTALSVAAYGRTVAILSVNRPTGTNTRILSVRTSLDGGATWRTAQKVAVGQSTTGGAGDGSVALTSSGVFVAWTDPATGEVLLRRSVVPGRGFGPAIRLGTTTSRDVQNIPDTFRSDVALAASNNRVAAFWAPDGIAQGSVGHIVERRSGDGGARWSDQATIASDAAVVVGARPAAVSVFSTTILVAYDRGDGRGAILRSTDAGGSWSTSAVTPPASPGGNPTIEDVVVGYGGVARLAYGSYTGTTSGDQQWIRSSADGGAHWGPATRAVGTVPSFKGDGNVVTSGTATVVVFSRYLTPTGGVDARVLR